MAWYIFDTIGLCNGLLPDGTKPLHEPLLIHFQKYPREHISMYVKQKNSW